MMRSACEDSHIQIDAARGDDAADLTTSSSSSSSTAFILLLSRYRRRRGVFFVGDAVGLGLRLSLSLSLALAGEIHVGGPADVGDEVVVGVGDDLDAFCFLGQIPAADGLVLGDGEEVAAGRVEEQGFDPVVVADEGLVARASVVPELDELVAAGGGEELG